MKLLIPPPLVALACAVSMWGIAAWLEAWRFEFPLQTVLGYALVAIGVGIDLWAVFAFRRARTTVTPLSPQKASSLVVTGLYRFTRNPMYLGLLLVLTGIAVLLGCIANVAVLAGFVAYITAFQIKPEEEKLSQIFGDSYLSYRQRVRRWM